MIKSFEGQLKVRNHWKMRGICLRTVPFAYVDHCSYLADSLLAQREVKAKFQSEMHRQNSDYCIIFCRVLRRDVQKFEEAMEKLQEKMLLLGHKTYMEECEEIAKLMEEELLSEKET